MTAADRARLAWDGLAAALGLETPPSGIEARERLVAACRHVIGAGSGRDASSRERAAGRLARGLADRWGLRGSFWPEERDRDDPIHRLDASDRRDDPSARELAMRGWHSVATGPWRAAFEDALRETAASVGARPHPLRMGAGPDGRTCGDCAWCRRGRCLQAEPPWNEAAATTRSTAACARWEPRLDDEDCGRCGACCREGYSMAPVRRGEAMLAAHPEWVVGSGRDAHLPRPGGRCVALAGDGASSLWRCRDYDARPRACSGLDVGGRGCLEARRRVGLSAG